MKKSLKGKRLIEEALACGNFIAMYIRGVMLLCESNPKGIGNLLEVLNDEHGKHNLLKCQKIFRLLAARAALFQSPNFQACQKTGMGIGTKMSLILMVMKNLWLCAEDA